jgi:hypothetical protein
MCYISYSLKLKYSNSTSHFTGKGNFINHILNNKRNSTPFNSSTICTFFLQKIVSFFSRGRKVDVRYCYMLDEKKKKPQVSQQREHSIVGNLFFIMITNSRTSFPASHYLCSKSLFTVPPTSG